VSILAIIGSVFKLIILILDSKLEKDKEIRAKKETALAEVSEGIKKRDASSVTAAFDKFNRI
jgi:hypothetical protein